MDPIFLTGLSAALLAVANKLAEKAIIDPSLEKGLEPFTSWLTKGYDKAKSDKILYNSFISALGKIDGPINDSSEVVSWVKKVGLDRLQIPKNKALREEFALAVVSTVSPEKLPPDSLLIALGWPRTRQLELSKLLFEMRSYLIQNDEWRPLIDFADRANHSNKLNEIIGNISSLNTTLVQTEDGNALRVVLIQQNLSSDQMDEIETAYRKSLSDEMEMMSTQGFSPAQLPKSIRLPLKDVYLELATVPLRYEHEQDEEKSYMLEIGDRDRLIREKERLNKRITDFLQSNNRIVIVGKPGSGKTISLKHIALMLSLGLTGAIRLRLDFPYLPLYVRLADYAQELRHNNNLALEGFLLKYIQEHYPGKPRQPEFLQSALDNNNCMILLDGLDEVGDIGDSLLHGKTLRLAVLEEVRRFADRRCKANGSNHIIVTSRIEGYQIGDLPNFAEMELSPLAIPQEVEEFLIRWFSAYEIEYNPDLSTEVTLRRSRERVHQLMTDIMRTESVQRLAMNPLLLTILAMIHEMGTRLPEQRVKLYETVVKTMVENWRQAQTRHVSSIYSLLPLSKIHELLSSLAYWLHENQPGGAMSIDDWRSQIINILSEDEDDDRTQSQLNVAVELFLRHAREELGLLTERSPGMIGFFHLTLEEYLAAVEIARQETDKRREMIEKHWSNPRWQEVILLTAGQLMLFTSKALDTFINELRLLETDNTKLSGRPVVLAGKAIVDVGPENFKRKLLRDVQEDLVEIMQNLNPNSQKPDLVDRTDISIRLDAADTLDQMGWLPQNLYSFIRISDKKYISQYPITNKQYEQFLLSNDFADEELWVEMPKFGLTTKGYEQLGNWGHTGWQWFQEMLIHSEDNSRIYPRYWKDPKFGNSRKLTPVVGISWFEANAFCKWLLKNWQKESCVFWRDENLNLIPSGIRLPVDEEWFMAAGGIQPEDRFPWDGSNFERSKGKKQALDAFDEDISKHANILETGIKRTSQISMFPLGVSPLGLWDMSGNVWEWQGNYSGKTISPYLTLRGGSWSNNFRKANVSAKSDIQPSYWNDDVGFRVLLVSK